MNTQVSFTLRGRNPDVLTCIANLSNDEVFTPPEFANRMLDTLAEAWAADHGGANLWADKTVRFLDPFTKSGVFLREITRRLTDGLKEAIPDLGERVDHILTKQVYGIAITRLTALLARRSVYCSKHAKGKHSIAKSFPTDDGNIWFERTEHTWEGEQCRYCGASKKTLDRGGDLESHAYAFIHTDDIKIRLAEMFGGSAQRERAEREGTTAPMSTDRTQELRKHMHGDSDMQFDVIIGNPPYQLDDGGHGKSAAPIYQHFVDQAMALEPRYVVMVTPSRWMAGGKGLDEYRARMLSDRRLRGIVDFPKLYEAFPGVKIRGGISYFVWDRDYSGPCSVQTMWDGQPTGPPLARYLDQYDILVRRNEAVPILEKVKAKKEETLDGRVSSRKPFGLATNFRGKPSSAGLKNPVRLFENQRTGWIEREKITTNPSWIDKWKVLMTYAQGTSSAIETKFLSKPIIAEPGTACTETYLVAGHFDKEIEAQNYAQYLRTRFVRFLVSLRRLTQHATRSVYAFVPDLPRDQVWTDAVLYKRYGLTKGEIAFIESQVFEHDSESVDEADEAEAEDE